MIPNYSDNKDARPLVYLDQNVIDKISKGQAQWLIELFSEKYRAVYSDITIEEILRAEAGREGSSKRFLDALANVNAYYISPVFDERMSPQDSVLIRDTAPTEIYAELEANDKFRGILEANTLISRKLVGGRLDQSSDDIYEELTSQFQKLDESINRHIAELEQFIPNARELLYGVFHKGDELSKVTTEQFNAKAREMITTLGPQIDVSSPKDSAMETFRSALKLSPIELNNIQPPNVVQQVWDFIAKDQSVKDSGLTIDQYFGLDGRYSVYPDRKPYKSELVQTVYHQLNYCGYHPDKKLHSDSNFTSSFSDMNHVSRASYCDYLMSGDERLVKKAFAAYEYVGVHTSAVQITYEG